MTPEVREHLDKARQCLARAKVILGAGIGEDVGRNAYLAAFHAAQALILAQCGKVVKTHRRRAQTFRSAGKERGTAA